MKVIGIDIGGTNTKFSLVGLTGSLVDSVHFKTNAHLSFEAFALTLKEQLDTYLEKHNLDYTKISLGIGVPNYSSVLESLVSHPNLAWGSIEIKKILKTYFTCDIFIENDANVAAMGEYIWGKARSVGDFVTLTVGTGIGSGIFISGALYSGYNGLAGEAGHLIIGSEGRRCNCGGQDHFENYCSVTGIKETLLNDLNEDITYFEIVKRFELGDEKILNIFRKTSKYFAVGIYQIIQLLRPKVIILSGGGMAVGRMYVEMIKESLRELTGNKKYDEKILLSDLSISNGAILGAAALAVKEHERRN